MLGLKRKLLAVAIGLALLSGALAQPQKGDRPPKDKEKPKVVVTPKGEKPPPSNDKGDKGKGDKKGRP